MEDSLRVIREMIPDVAVCSRCKTHKPKDQFQRNPRYRAGVASWCKRCLLDFKKETRAKAGRLEARKRKVVDGKLPCVTCKEWKPIDQFYGNPKMTSGKASCCKPCDNDRKKAWIKNNPDLDKASKLRSADRRRPFARDRHLQKNYGITKETYDVILQMQGGRCVICRTDRNCDGRAMSVDHDHKSGKVRGVLCNQCNRSLGTLQDNWRIAQAAADYLKKYSGEM